MLTLTVKSIRAHKGRFLLTGVAVLLGVAFMAGTFVLTDTIKKSYDGISTNAYRSTDAVVRSARATDSTKQGVPTTRGTISASMLDAVRAAPAVQAAEPQLTGIAVVVGRDGRLLDANPNRPPPVAMAWQDAPALNPMTLVSGQAPRAPDEIVIDRSSAETGHFAVGDTVQVLSQAGSRAYRIAGVATYGGADSAAGAPVVAFTPDAATEAIGTPGRYSAIQVVGARGVSQAQLVDDLRIALRDPSIEVVTGAQAAAEARDAMDSSLQFVDMFLMPFAIVALVVGSFVIHNTFSITVAQRTKETALLRAIGAKRRQVMRAIRFEALLVGMTASTVGLAVGIALAHGLRSVLSAFGVDLPSGGLVIQPRTIVVSMVTGLVVTLVAAWLPARRAARTAPIEALRATALDHSTNSRRRVVLGVLTTGAGALLIAQGLSGAGAGAVGLGAFAVFFGVALLGPVIARRFTRVVGSPLRLRGMAGTLARENAMRNPRRTAATSSALMIGVGLVAFITVFAASTKASISTSVERAMKTDWIVRTQFGMGGLSPSVAQHIDALPETGVVTTLRYFDAKVDGSTTSASAVDPARVTDGVALDMRAGDITKLGTDGVGVRSEVAQSRNLHLGDTVTVSFPETGDRRFTVVAVYGITEPLGDYVISTQAYDANMAAHVDSDIVVSRAPGVSEEAARQAVARVLDEFPNAKLMTKSEFKGAMASEIDKMLNLVDVLLAMAVVIALLGIANTLALSVLERTREFALLRAIGMSRAQVRASVRWESVLIALLGTSLGTVIGLGFGWALVKALEDQGFDRFTVPVQQLVVIVVVAALAAVGAAAWPARRAAKLDVLAGISSE